jgi:hypothetical protein
MALPCCRTTRRFETRRLLCLLRVPLVIHLVRHVHTQASTQRGTSQSSAIDTCSSHVRAHVTSSGTVRFRGMYHVRYMSTSHCRSQLFPVQPVTSRANSKRLASLAPKPIFSILHGGTRWIVTHVLEPLLSHTPTRLQKHYHSAL